jgi:hypothetical protein
MHFDRLNFSNNSSRCEHCHHTGLDNTSLDTSNGYSSDTTDLVHILKGKTEGLVGRALRRVELELPANPKPPSSTPHGFLLDSNEQVEVSEGTSQIFSGRRPRSDSAGLDALAALAEREQRASTHRPLPAFLMPGGGSCTPVSSSSSASSSQSDEKPDDAETMPPPPQRAQLGRQRSVSNPEGMEKWDSLLNSHTRSNRRHFLLPSTILEEELAEANEAVKRHAGSPLRECSIPEHAEFLGPLVLQESSENSDRGALQDTTSIEDTVGAIFLIFRCSVSKSPATAITKSNITRLLGFGFGSVR